MTSITLHGVGVSEGYAIGEAHRVSHALFEVSHYPIPESHLAAEINRYTSAINAVKQELYQVHQQFLSHAPESLSGLMSTHLLLLNDKLISEKPKQLIQSHACNAEWAIKLQMDELVAEFDHIEDAYLRERKQDVLHVVERIIKVLLGLPNPFAPAKEDGTPSKENAILVAHDLSPADAIQFKQDHFAAFITDVGGTNSHTAILARSLNIPAIVALQRARDFILEGDQLIIDGEAGVVTVNPSPAILAEYQLRKEAWELEQQRLQRLKDTKPITLFGTPISLMGNIEVPDDVEAVKAAGGAGIGLFRTEFLFMNQDRLPDEETQFQSYKAVAQTMQDLPVTIRTLDLGADKLLDSDGPKLGANPALGLRAIRYSLAEPTVFVTQLRAILRASAFGTLKILIPMLTTLAELRQTQKLITQTKAFLREEGVPFDENIEIGGMIEIPAAAINAEAMAQELDFLSIGTNDLIQYTLAIDRTDDAVAHLYNPLHPSILRLIEMTIQACTKHNKSLSLCGEMAGDPKLTKLLVGMGLRELSMHPSHLLRVKQQVLHSEIKKLDKLAKKVLELSDIAKIELLVEKMHQQ